MLLRSLFCTGSCALSAGGVSDGRGGGQVAVLLGALRRRRVLLCPVRRRRLRRSVRRRRRARSPPRRRPASARAPTCPARPSRRPRWSCRWRGRRPRRPPERTRQVRPGGSHERAAAGHAQHAQHALGWGAVARWALCACAWQGRARQAPELPDCVRRPRVVRRAAAAGLPAASSLRQALRTA